MVAGCCFPVDSGWLLLFPGATPIICKMSFWQKPQHRHAPLAASTVQGLLKGKRRKERLQVNSAQKCKWDEMHCACTEQHIHHKGHKPTII